MKPQVKKTLTHIAAVIIMLIAACLYFAPALSGDIIYQGDSLKADEMAYRQRAVADSTGSIPNWNPSMFGGMPGYQIAVEAPKSVFTPLKSLLIMRPLGLERNIGILWLYLLGFYIAMIAFGCNPWLSLFGAVAFGLGSYNIIIIEAGHITKAWAMSMMAPVIGGMMLCLRAVMKDEGQRRRLLWRRLVWGLILFTLALGLQITFNHIQITFYTAIGCVVMGLTYAVYALRQKWFKPFLAVVGLLVVGCLFAVGANYRHLTVNQEYAKATMRGGSEISVKPHDIGSTDAAQEQATQSGGLDINYAFSWSYGIGETYTILVPRSMGGSSHETLGDDSEWTQQTRQPQAPLYWGDQPFTSGPVYFGAIVVFLFILGCIVVKGPDRWWLIITTIIAIILAWGRHCMPINEFLFNHLPLYNKFRTPSMGLVLANVTMVIMATLTLKHIVDAISAKAAAKNILKSKKTPDAATSANADAPAFSNKQLYTASAITAGILLVGIIYASTSLKFTSVDNDEGIKNQYLNAIMMQGATPEQAAQWEATVWSQWQQALVHERKSAFMADSWRSMAFVVLAFALLWLYTNGKLKKPTLLVVLMTLLTTIDLWAVDRRYLNKDNFIEPERVKIHRSESDLLLDQVAAMNGDQDYRVYDLTVNTFNDSRPSAFHDQIGGYSPAKLRRYQDLIDFYIGSDKFSKYFQQAISSASLIQTPAGMATILPYPVLDMLNTRYLMVNTQGNQATPLRRTSALGSCWFVQGIRTVDNANAEILALNSFNPYDTAIVDQSQWADRVAGLTFAPRDSSESIQRIHTYPQTPDRLTYKSHTSSSRLAVFSEVFYAPDWRAYIDGQPTEYLRVDYILRAIVVPAGDHTIEFVNEAPTLHRNDTISLIVGIIMLLLMAGALVVVYRKPQSSPDQTL